MNILSNSLIGLCSLASITSFGNKPGDNSKPNVILVMTDDQGYGDMSCHGHPFLRTPQFDRLYNESVRLTNFHVDPNCAPTRSALMTGKYSTRTGVWHVIQGRTIMNKDEITLAQVFEENQYMTGLFGKWHLGDNYPYRPQDRGFQEVLFHGGGGVGQNPDFWRNDYFNDVYIRNGEYEFHEGYCTDVWFENAIRFIEGHNPQKTGKPFFCYIAANAPHDPYFIQEEYASPFREKGMPDQLSRYLGMIANIDENMGRLLTRLEELSLKENTIFIFMTDNGQSRNNLPQSGPFYYNAGMRGVKGSNYDGGHRVPCFIRWPKGGIQGGKDISQLTAHFDLMPTLIDLCQLKNKHTIDFDGKSLVPLLKDNNSKWEERTLFVHRQGVFIPEKWRTCAVLTEEFRLIDGKELYNIKKDPSQETDIAALRPEVVEKLKKEYDHWWNHISERFDEYSRIYIGDEHENPLKLTCNKWLSSEMPLAPTWNYEVIRKREHKNGFWALYVVKDGEYEFTFRTYPKEEDNHMNVDKVKLKIGDQEIEKECYPEAAEVKLKLKLKEGETLMQTWFYEKDGNNYGVPFIYIERL